MTLALLTGPAAEPVTLAEARAHLRLDGTEENPLVEALIAAAVRRSKRSAARLRDERWRLMLDHCPHGQAVRLPLALVVVVTAVRCAAAMLPIDLGYLRTLMPPHF